MRKALYKLLLAVASIIVLTHNLTPHHHHSPGGAALSQFQDDDHDDGLADHLATLQLDHTFQTNHSVYEMPALDRVVSQLYCILKPLGTPVETIYTVVDEYPPDKPLAFPLAFRGPPAHLS